MTQWAPVLEADDLIQALTETLEVLACDDESRLLLVAVMKKAQEAKVDDDDRLIVGFTNGESLYVTPARPDASYADWPSRMREMMGRFDALTYPDDDPWCLALGPATVSREMLEGTSLQGRAPVRAAVQVYDDWYLYHPEEIVGGDPRVLFLDHAGGELQAPKSQDVGVLFLRELAEGVGLDVERVLASGPVPGLELQRTLVRFVDEPRDSVPRVCSSPDGSVLCLPDENEDGLQLVRRGGEVLRRIDAGTYVYPTAFSPCGRFFAYGDRRRRVVLLDAKEGTTIRVHPSKAGGDEDGPLGDPSGHNDWLKWLAFSGDGEKLVSGSKAVTVLATKDGQLLSSLAVGSRPLRAPSVPYVDLVSDDALLVAADKLFIAAEGKPDRVFEIDGQPFKPLCAAVDSDRRLVVASEMSGGTHLWSLEGEYLRQLTDYRAFALAFAPKGDRIALARELPCLEVLDTDGTLLARAPLPGKGNSSLSAYSVAFLEAGTRVLVGHPAGADEYLLEV